MNFSPSPNDFCFDSFLTEDMTFYVPGGYHPVTIGDILGPSPLDESRRYRIMHKLGHGALATVWLAQKTGEKGEWVAVKITISANGLTNEAAMLEAACKSRTSPGHFPTLHDHFSLHGPNGIHSVLVMDVVVPLDSDIAKIQTPSSMKFIARGLFESVSQLHYANIVHGDLHIGNIGLAFPQLANLETDEIMSSLGVYDLTVVLPYSAARQTPSLPPYIAGSCDIVKYYQSIARTILSQTLIYDFGNAHYSGTLPKSFVCACIVCAPELVFAIAIEKIDNPHVEPPADIWALGTTLYQLFTGLVLFEGHISPRLAHNMTILGGSPPQAWRDWYSSLSPSFSQTDTDEWWASRWKEVRENCDQDVDADMFISFLKKILVLDPAFRPTAEEILKDPWFNKQISLVLDYELQPVSVNGLHIS